MNDYTDQMKDAYSFNRPAYIVGQSLIEGMISGGLTEEEALSLFYSKAYRWALDFDLGLDLRDLATAAGKKMASEYQGHEWTRLEIKGVTA